MTGHLSVGAGRGETDVLIWQKEAGGVEEAIKYKKYVIREYFLGIAKLSYVFGRSGWRLSYLAVHASQQLQFRVGALRLPGVRLWFPPPRGRWAELRRGPANYEQRVLALRCPGPPLGSGGLLSTAPAPAKWPARPEF